MCESEITTHYHRENQLQGVFAPQDFQTTIDQALVSDLHSSAQTQQDWKRVYGVAWVYFPPKA